MDRKLEKLLNSRLDDIMNYAYCQPHHELPDNPKEAFERYSKLLERRK